MSIIDLKTGKKKDPQAKPEQQVTPQVAPIEQPAPPQVQNVPGRIIDLETGQFVSQSQPQQPIEQPQQPIGQGSIFSTVTGPAIAIGGGFLTDVSAGLRALGNLMMGEGLEESAKVTEETKRQMGEYFAPDTQRGKEALATLGGLVQKGIDIANIPLSGLFGLVELGTGQGVDKAAETIKSVREKGLGATMGERMFEETNSPELAAIAHIVPEAAMELTALKGLRETRLSKPELIQEGVQSNIERQSAMAAQEASDALNVGLFQPQKTLNPTALVDQRIITEQQGGSIKARNELIKQNAEVAKAVDNVLNLFAEPESVATGPARFRTAAQDALDKQKQIRKEGASPIYKQAYRRQREGKTGLIETQKLQTKIDEMAKQFDPDGQIAKNLKLASKKIKKANGDLQRLHSVKIELDQIINSFGQDSVGNTTKRFLTDVVTDLTDNLTEQSPSYRAAKSEFERLSDPINKMQDSPIGRIAKLDDVQLKQVSSLIFDPSTNIKVMEQAKKAITDTDPGAWNELVRVELEKRIGKIKTDITTQGLTKSTENVPAQLYSAIFGNKKNRDVLFAAVDGDAKQNLKYLETVLKRAQEGRPGGSDTAIKTRRLRELQGGMFQSLRNFISSPIDTVARAGEDVAFDKKTRALSDVIFDTTWRDDMRKLRKLPPASSQAKRLMDNILNSALLALPTVDEPQQEQ